MFNDSKYTRAYYRIAEKAKAEIRRKGAARRYDRHHVIPRSLGGVNTKENVVLLTPREHYVCHLLLLRMTAGKARSKMTYAFFRFSPKGSGITSSRAYEQFLKSACTALYGTGNCFFGRHHTAETKQLISQNHGMRGTNCYRIWSERFGKDEADARYERMNEKRSAALSGSRNPQFGRPRTAVQKLAQSRRMTGSAHPLYGSTFTWMHRNGELRRASPIEVATLMQEGWMKGMPRKRAR